LITVLEKIAYKRNLLQCPAAGTTDYVNHAIGMGGISRMTAYCPSRHLAAVRQAHRFRAEADMLRRVTPPGL
jgi:hypothetical protein